MTSTTKPTYRMPSKASVYRACKSVKDEWPSPTKVTFVLIRSAYGRCFVSATYSHTPYDYSGYYPLMTWERPKPNQLLIIKDVLPILMKRAAAYVQAWNEGRDQPNA